MQGQPTHLILSNQPHLFGIVTAGFDTPIVYFHSIYLPIHQTLLTKEPQNDVINNLSMFSFAVGCVSNQYCIYCNRHQLANNKILNI